MFYDDVIYNTARADKMPERLAIFLVAQARHETGNYKSHFFTQGKNAFGYSYYAGAKWQLPTPGPIADNNAPIAQYSSVENSVHEITDWIKRRQAEGKFPQDLRTITSPYQYAELLKNAGYYGASLNSYAAALVNHLEEIADSINSGSNGMGLIALVLLILILKK